MDFYANRCPDECHTGGFLVHQWPLRHRNQERIKAWLLWIVPPRRIDISSFSFMVRTTHRHAPWDRFSTMRPMPWRTRADSIAIRVTDPAEAGIVTRFGVSQAPMPLVLVLAPNGAVTASFPGKFTKEQLLGAFGTPSMERLLGALQQGKLALLCLQNGRTRGTQRP